VWKIRPKVCRCARYGSLARPAAPVAIELAFAHRPSGSGSALAYFPLRGKIAKTFSIAWNFFAHFFHSVEKFPQSCSIVWKNL